MLWYKVSLSATPQVEVEDHQAPEKLHRVYLIQSDTFLNAIDLGIRAYTADMKTSPDSLSIHLAEEIVVPTVMVEKKPIAPSPQVVQMLDKSRSKKE